MLESIILINYAKTFYGSRDFDEVYLRIGLGIRGHVAYVTMAWGWKIDDGSARCEAYVTEGVGLCTLIKGADHVTRVIIDDGAIAYTLRCSKAAGSALLQQLIRYTQLKSVSWRILDDNSWMIHESQDIVSELRIDREYVEKVVTTFCKRRGMETNWIGEPVANQWSRDNVETVILSKIVSEGGLTSANLDSDA